MDFICGLQLWMIVCLQDGRLPVLVKERYSSYSEGIGRQIVDGKVEPCPNPKP